MIKQPQILLIDWVDSHSCYGWLNEDEIHNADMLCQSIGFLIKEDKKNITLALSRALNENYKPYGDTITIPKVTIRKRSIIKGKLKL